MIAAANPRRRRRHHRNARRRGGGGGYTQLLRGAFNPRHHRRRSGGGGGGGGSIGLGTAMRQPGTLIIDGLASVTVATFTLTLPNWLLGGMTSQAGMMGTLTKGIARIATGGLLVGLVQKFAPRQARAALAGASLAAVGGIILDLTGGRLLIGTGDQVQTSGMTALFGTGGFSLANLGLGAYTRAPGTMPGLGAYTRAPRTMPGLHGAFGPYSSRPGAGGMLTRNALTG